MTIKFTQEDKDAALALIRTSIKANDQNVALRGSAFALALSIKILRAEHPELDPVAFIKELMTEAFNELEFNSPEVGEFLLKEAAKLELNEPN